MSVINRVSLQPGYILHHWAYRDTSLLIEVLTRDHGRIGLVARGAKRAKSRLYGVLQPFIPLIVSWSGRGDLGTLSAAESQGPIAWLSGRAMMNGFYVNELLLRLLHRHDPHPHIYDEYSHVLQRLSALPVESTSESSLSFHEQRALRIFEKNLLRELGYGLVLDHDVVTGQAVRGDGYYEYYLDKGPVLQDSSSNLNLNHANKNGNEHITLHGHSLISLALDKLEDDVSLQESKKLMRAILKRHLGEKPLGSRQLFRHFAHSTVSNTEIINT